MLRVKASATSSSSPCLTWSSTPTSSRAERSRELSKGAPTIGPAMRLLVLFSVALVCLRGGGGGGGVAASTDFNFPAVFNFGDSNSDTGGRVAAGLEAILPPYGSAFFGEPAGRFCDGRLIIDFLMHEMDMPFLNAYLDSVGLPNFRTGVNFAQAGCSITPANPTSVSPFSFGLQIKQFFAFKDKVTRLLAKGANKEYIPQADYFSQGLYMFDIGQNDLAGEFYSKTEDQVIASIPTILAEFENGLQKLYDQGARKFWIHNTGPLGCLPQNVAFFGKDPSQLDELHCVAKHNRVARAFNLQLHALCSKLRAQFTGASLTYVDVYTIKYSLIANHSRYGFEHPIQACCGYGGPPLNYDSRVPCGQTVSLNGHQVTAKGCSDSAEHVNWDGIHYTEAANFHIVSQILTGKYSDPPFVDKMPFILKPRF